MDKIKILVVDDEPDVVAMIQRALQGEGFEVACAYDGISAIDLAETEKPGLILLDIMMPMMSGYEVCQQLRSNPRTREIPVLCVTSAHNPDTRHRAHAVGAQGILIKPFIPGDLVAQIRGHLQIAKADAPRA
jgi:DNA-binding response OmpR family regulator